MSQLTCASCGHENDNTRVFCQNCGVRLASAEPEGEMVSGAAPVAGAASTPPPVPAQKKAAAAKPQPTKKLRPPGVHDLEKRRSPLKGCFSALVYGAIVAAVIVAFKTPDNVPPPFPRPSTEAAQATESTLRAAADAEFPGSFKISPSAANNFLTVRLPGIDKSRAGYITFAFERSYLLYGEQELEFGIIAQSKLLPLHVRYLIDVPKEGEAFVTGVYVGKLPIHPKLQGLLGRITGPIIDHLEDPISWFRKAKKIDLSPETAEVFWLGRVNVTNTP